MTQRVCDDCYYRKLGGDKEPCSSCRATIDGLTNWRKAPQTNADRFRAMSNEEQQNFVRKFWEIEDFADWLHQPAEVDE